MEYRHLGSCGLRVSALGLGSWVTFGSQLDEDLAGRCMAAAREGGINFFDNAEVYGGGESECLMGGVIARQRWPRYSYVISTKLYWGLHDDPNTRRTLNRKYLLESIDGSLERLGLDYVDLLYCHRSDPDTPLEETVWAMSDIVSSGKALYWGTSEWSATDIREAWEIAEIHHLRKPVVEQPRYNLVHRENVEDDLAPLYEDIGLGLTTWSPLASGLLTGKYLDGVPDGSRATLEGYEWLKASLTDPDANAKVRRLAGVAESLGCSLAQLAIAWCVRNPHVSSVITGASRVEQVSQNLAAMDVVPKLTPQVLACIDTALQPG